MKKSKFNLEIPISDDQVLIYNSMNNGLNVMSKEEYEVFNNLNLYIKEIENYSFLKELKHDGFIVPADTDENMILRYKLFANRYGNSKLALTIAPTLNCNFDCVYCYEQNERVKSTMDSDTIDSIIKLVESKSKNIDTLLVCWYGGEPLLEVDVIKELSNAFIDICKNNNIEYIAHMVTNGYLLKKETAYLLNDLKVSSYQVTIDGEKNSHDSRRMLHNGRGTYDVILRNLKDISTIVPRVSIRVNIDKQNEDDLMLVKNQISEIDTMNVFNVYPGKVENTNNAYNDNACFSDNEFANMRQSNIKIDSKEMAMKEYPEIRSTYCGADNTSSFVINYNGDLYKCWVDIGDKEKSIGNIQQIEQNTHNSIFFDYLMFDSTSDNKCKDCEILPICMGGCPNERVSKKEPQCITEKYYLTDKLKAIGEFLLSEIE